MIKVIDEGKYELLETKDQTKILRLGERQYAWVNAEEIGEILVYSEGKVDTDTLLAAGEYKVYEVKDEKDYRDLEHLELNAGDGRWQSYLLLTGLPTENDRRNRIIPTEEVIGK